MPEPKPRAVGAPGPDAAALDAAVARASRAYRRACALDVAVRKPGNVSRASPGHGMQAALFDASAAASAGPLFARGARIGDRIEAAVAATWQVAGCNTNLGIVLLCAPLARALERRPGAAAAAWRVAVEAELAALDVADAAAAYRAIAQARPGGLGSAPAQDVTGHAPTIGLRAAMALAADRDRIARQYRDGFGEVFDHAAAALAACPALAAEADHGAAPDAAVTAAVQRLYLAFLAGAPDSHIVRKHGAAVAQTVMRSAQGWRARAEAGERLDDVPAFAAWDAALKAAGLNPGTSADLTVAALFAAALPGVAAPCD